MLDEPVPPAAADGPPENVLVARARIRKVIEAGEPDLDLGDLGLDELPDELGAATSLRRLSFSTMSLGVGSGVDERDRPRRMPCTFPSITCLSGLENLR